MSITPLLTFTDALFTYTFQKNGDDSLYKNGLTRTACWDLLQMNHLSIRSRSGFHNGFAHGRVRVNSLDNIMSSGF